MHGARSEARAVCTARLPGPERLQPGPAGHLDGQVIDITPVEQTVEQLPTGQLVSIKFNEQTRSGNTLDAARRAPRGPGSVGRVVKDVVVAESRVAGGSQVCDRAAQEDTAQALTAGSAARATVHHAAPSTSPRATSASSRASATATSPTAARCDRRRTPFAGPSGGRVALRSEAPKSARKSSCLKGEGVKFLVLGTKRADSITGSNRADPTSLRRQRVVVAAATTASPAARADKLAGASADPSEHGGSEADKLYGGSGRDSINSAYGRDKVNGGKGNDAINISIAGPAARVNCGKGKDTVRYNNNERRRMNGCERRYSIQASRQTRQVRDPPESRTGSGAPRASQCVTDEPFSLPRARRPCGRPWRPSRSARTRR